MMNIMPWFNVFPWHQKFKDDHELLEDDPHSRQSEVLPYPSHSHTM